MWTFQTQRKTSKNEMHSDKTTRVLKQSQRVFWAVNNKNPEKLDLNISSLREKNRVKSRLDLISLRPILKGRELESFIPATLFVLKKISEKNYSGFPLSPQKGPKSRYSWGSKWFES